VSLSIAIAETLAGVGEKRDALLELTGALEIGARAGLHQSFVDAGHAVGHMLMASTHELPLSTGRRNALEPYLGALSSAWRSNHQAGHTRFFRPGNPLSPRERGILALIRRGYSNKQVAGELQIAPETVKYHAKRIFEKLETRTRTQAVSKAETLGLI